MQFNICRSFRGDDILVVTEMEGETSAPMPMTLDVSPCMRSVPFSFLPFCVMILREWA